MSHVWPSHVNLTLWGGSGRLVDTWSCLPDAHSSFFCWPNLHSPLENCLSLTLGTHAVGGDTQGSGDPGWSIDQLPPPPAHSDYFRNGHRTQSGSMSLNPRRFLVAVGEESISSGVAGRMYVLPSRVGELLAWEESRPRSEERQVAANIVWVPDSNCSSSSQIHTHKPL